MQLYRLVKRYSISKTLFITYFTFIVLILYFLIKLFFGQKGVAEMMLLKNQVLNQDLTKKELINEIKARKLRVDGIGLESLDLDLLDEQARKNLGHSTENEIVIYEESDDKNN